MAQEKPEPIERLEEILSHPADKTLNALHDKGLLMKKELTGERSELGLLLAKLPAVPPKQGSKGYSQYAQIQKQIQSLKERVCKKHDELMEILKNEERIIREIQEKNSK